MGNVKGTPPGDDQRVSAGTGVVHIEFNHAPDKTAHFLQIWITLHQTGIAPSDEQKTIPLESSVDAWLWSPRLMVATMPCRTVHQHPAQLKKEPP